MQSTIALALSFLALTASAAPTPRSNVGSVTVQFFNDITGHNGDAPIPLDGTPVTLGQAYASSDLEVAGTLFVTSLQFTADFTDVSCDVFAPGKGEGSTPAAHIADPAEDFQRFKEVPVDWQEFTIVCTRPQ